jgi:small subunit ribosomal protein S7
LAEEEEKKEEGQDAETKAKDKPIDKEEKTSESELKKKESEVKEIEKEKVEEEVKIAKSEKLEEKKVKEEKEGEEKFVRRKSMVAEERKADTPEEILPGLSPLLFGKYNLTEVVVEDPGLRRYINLKPVGIPHTGAKHANKWFGKTRINIVERLINNMMRTEHSTGKKSFAYKTVRNAFDIIEKRTKQNPIQVLINALQNSSPKEEITRLRFGGISVPKAVDTSSSHRLDVAIRNICKGAVNSSHKNKKRVELCLAEEIILASKADMNSFAISKKEEMERIAASAR